MTIALIVAAVIVYLVERLRPVYIRRLEFQRPQSQKGVDLPPDLRLLVNSEREGWARQEVEQRFREMYTDLGSWPAVREMVSGSSSRS